MSFKKIKTAMTDFLLLLFKNDEADEGREEGKVKIRDIPSRHNYEVKGFHLRMQGVLAFIVAALTLYTFGRFCLSLLWGGILAIICWPVASRLMRRWPSSHGRSAVAAACVVGVVLIFVVPMILLVSVLTDEAGKGIAWVKDIIQNGLPEPVWVERLPWGAAAAHGWWQQNLASPEELRNLFGHLKFDQLMKPAASLGHSFVSILVIMGFALLIQFFFLRSGDEVAVRCERLGVRLFGVRARMVCHYIVSAVRGTMAGLVLVGLGEGALISVAYFVAGAPQPVLLGVFTALASMIPIVGSVALLVCCLLIAVKGSMISAICVAVYGSFILFMGDHFVRPVLIGGSVRLPFVWVLMGILGGLETWGIKGLFIGPVLTAVAYFIWSVASGGGLAKKSKSELLAD
ncbi:AI-2E family transporter [Acetobacter thailandicus]|uniref:AI-2E family transporter n=1 Tax=Acetobacter thailandicus TaxID=1502842 RepID=UPI0020110550|nr:AI-2E family transporter [Acetobacter thailandicus]